MSGEMKFSATIYGPSGELVDCNFELVEGSSFRVQFVPLRTGNHVIKIYKGSSSIPLSEFAHNIGPENVGANASFTINVEEQKKSYTATVTSPSNVTIECTIDQSEDGNVMVRFTPKELGDHYIKIFADDSYFPVSEFVYNVTDLDAEVGTGTGGNQSPNKYRVGEKAKIILNGDGGGEQRPPGKYRVVVTSPRNQHVDSDFEEHDDGRCKVRFVPRETGDYIIKVFKIGSDKAIYEFTFTAERDHVGETTTFTITIQEQKIRFSAIVTSPSNADVECTIEEHENDNYIIRFVPREIGNYKIKLFQDGIDDPISQFMYKVVDRTTNIPKESVRVYRVGETVRLTFNTDGRVIMPNSKFSASVTSPTGVPLNCIFEELDNGNCKIRFVPTELGKYLIKLYKIGNKEPISQFTFDSEHEHLNDTASFTITIQERLRRYSAKVTSPSNKEIECSVEEGEDGNCIVRFTPKEVGNYIIQIFENNEHTPSATIIYKIVDRKYDLSRKKPTDRIYRVGEPVRLIIDIAEEKRKFTATVTSPSNANIECRVEENEEGNPVVRFTPNEAGDYVIRVYQGNNPIPIYQFTYVVEEKPNQVYRVGETANFSLKPDEGYHREYSASVTSPSGEHLHNRVEELEDGSCRVRFIPKESGDYIIRLFQNDMQISQFTYKVNEAVKRKESTSSLSSSSSSTNLAYGSNLKDNVDGKFIYIQDQVFKVGDKVSFHVNVDNIEREFSASVTSPAHKLLDTEVIETSTDEFLIRFTPRELGDHLIKIYLGTSKEPLYQFIYKVRGFIGKPVEFKVTSFMSEPGRLAYKIMCPPNSKINYGDKKDGTGKNDGGLYEINVRFNTDENSANSSQVGSGAERITAEGLGLKHAKVGEVSNFKVNAEHARRGSLMVGVEGPKQPAKEIVVKHISGQIYSVDYVLDMVGNYCLYVMWSGEHIPGSPFHVKV